MAASTPPPGPPASSGRRLSDALHACSREELLGYVHTLERRALHDPLTGLANRALLEDRLQQGIALSRRNRAPFALLVCDLDGFKDVNDRHGHEVGDEALRCVADRLRGVLRASDSVARLGGDEFAVLLPATDRAGAEVVADKISTVVGRPMSIAGQAVTVGCSVGISMFPADAQDAAGLVRLADGQMYGTKGRRRRSPLRRLTRVLALGAVLVAGSLVSGAGTGPPSTDETATPDVPGPALAAPAPPGADAATTVSLTAASRPTPSSTRQASPVVLVSPSDDEDDEARLVRTRSIIRGAIEEETDPGPQPASSDDEGRGKAKGKGQKDGDAGADDERPDRGKGGKDKD